jgi:hypothetical protein
MKKNVGKLDATIRIVLAIVIALLYFTNVITGTLGIILMILGGVFLLTGFINFCPIWLALGIRTNKKEDK